MNDLTLLISTCEKFSDIWNIQCSLLNENWGDRDIRTVLLTDAPNPYRHDGVEIVSAGDGADMKDRLSFFVDAIDTEYVLITLDDYFLTKKVDNTKIQSLIRLMEAQKLDYIRLFPSPHSRKTLPIEGEAHVRMLTFDKRYDVNLYPGLWRKSFLKETLAAEQSDAWQYEVSLTKTAVRLNARCAWCKEDVYHILDAVRKGKFLHPAKRFVDSYGHYEGDRGVIARKEEIRIAVLSMINRTMPESLRKFLKRKARKHGAHFYSPD